MAYKKVVLKFFKKRKKENIKRINSQYLKNFKLCLLLINQSIINQLLCYRRRMCMLQRLHLK